MLERPMAEQEFTRWLDLKKIKPSRIESKKEIFEAKETIVDAIAEGQISIDEKGNLTVKLNCPIGENEQIEELTFKPRMMAFELDKLNRVATDTGKSRAMIEILTGQMSAIVRLLDSNDFALCNAVVVFYYLQ